MREIDQTILIVDDEKANRKILRQLLQDDVDIIFAKNGEQAINLADKHQPDLILLDVIMADLSGFDVIKILKNQASTKGISVIFITALSNVLDEVQGFDLGACDYIYKPFQSTIVIARVMLHLELIKQRKMLNNVAHIDALTGVPNRRQLDITTETEMLVSKRNNTRLLVALLDVDFFKPYNDNYGHGAGDQALKKIGSVLKGIGQRPRDFVARYGGEEFVFIMPDIDFAGATLMLQNTLKEITKKAIPHDFSTVSDKVTISIGAVLVDASQAGDINNYIKDVMKATDTLLYKAKQNGRNQFVLETFCRGLYQ